jgi:fibronectin-binding autotransporter adhesin
MHTHRPLAFFGKILLAIAVFGLAIMDIQAATQVWTAGGTGDFNDSTKYNAGAGPAPSAGDDVTSDGTGSVITFDLGDTITLNSLQLNVTTGATVFNQTGGDLTLGTLTMGGAGGTRNPTYNFSGGTLNVNTAFTWGSGTNVNFIQSGGTVNTAATVGSSIGTAAGAVGTITISAGIFNHNNPTAQFRLGHASGGQGHIVMTGGTFNAATPQMRIGASGNGSMTLSGSAIFNLATPGTTYLGNNGANGDLTMSGSSQFNASGHVISVGQFGSGTGTLTMSGSSTLSAARLVLGGDNANSPNNGIINLNGGTITTGTIRRGASDLVSSATSLVLRGNGGTIRAVSHTGNPDFLQGVFVDLQAGGLTLNSNGVDITVTNSMSGVGGLTKTGAGTLTLSGVSTYTGVTGIQAGTVRLGVSDAINVASNVVLSGGRLGFSTGNFSQGTTVAVGIGTLDLDATSILDFAGGDQLLHFANSSGLAWTGTLDVYNWDGALDNLYFGTDNTGLTVGQLAQINFYSGDGTGFLGLGAWAGADGEVMVVIPEPSTYALLFAGLFVVVIARRKRLSVSA